MRVSRSRTPQHSSRVFASTGTAQTSARLQYGSCRAAARSPRWCVPRAPMPVMRAPSNARSMVRTTSTAGRVLTPVGSVRQPVGAWRRTDSVRGAPVSCDWRAARLLASRSIRSTTATLSAPRGHMSSAVGVATRTAVIRSTATPIISSSVDERRSNRAPAGPEPSPGATRRQL